MRGKGPDIGPGFEEPGQFVAADSDGADQGDARKEGRPRRANVGIEALELVFCLEDIGTPQQHGGGEARANILHLGLAFRKRPGEQFGRDLAPDHQIEVVFILRHQGGGAGDIHPRRLHLGLSLSQIQLG